MNRRALLGLLTLGAVWATPLAAHAAAPLIGTPKGRPKIQLDRLELPPGVDDAKFLSERLSKQLKRAARRADWGAGRGAMIRFRFRVETLELTRRADVLTVRCGAVGVLPGGRSARTKLTYSGDPSDSRGLILRVLEIAARGVVARLSDLERTRRVG